MPCCSKIVILCGCLQSKAGNIVDPWNYLVPIWIRKVGILQTDFDSSVITSYIIGGGDYKWILFPKGLKGNLLAHIT